MDKHILVVEDSPTQSLLVARVLEDAGFKVFAASDGLAALKHLSTHSPQLVISDVTMPAMDGYQLCRAIRADTRLENLPVLLLTDLADEEKVLTGLEAGADAFISKPFDNARLLARVRDLIAGNGQQENAGAGTESEVLFASKKYRIVASRSRILGYLISTYDNALQINARLAGAQEELRDWNLILEERVRARTAALSQEVEQRKRAQAAVQVTNRLLEIANRHRDKELLLREFVAEIRSFSGCEKVVISLREQGDDYSKTTDGSSTSEARIPIRLGEEAFGHIFLGDSKENNIAQETMKVLEAASTQLAAALMRIQAEETLRESEERYRHFFEDDLAGAHILTTDGLIKDCNPAFTRTFGFPDTAHAVGSSFVEMYWKPKDWEELIAILRRQGRIASRETEYCRLDGAHVFVIESAVGKFNDRRADRGQAVSRRHHGKKGTRAPALPVAKDGSHRPAGGRRGP
jgi:PAS domain S-box-containing protein